MRWGRWRNQSRSHYSQDSRSLSDFYPREAKYRSSREPTKQRTGMGCQGCRAFQKRNSSATPLTFYMQRQAANDRPNPKKCSLRKVMGPGSKRQAQLREFQTSLASSVLWSGTSREIWQLCLGVKDITVPSVE